MTGRKFVNFVCTVAGAAMLTGCVSCGVANRQNKEQGEKNMFVVRIAEIEVHPEWLEAYLSAAGTVGAEVRLDIETERFCQAVVNIEQIFSSTVSDVERLTCRFMRSKTSL